LKETGTKIQTIH